MLRILFTFAGGSGHLDPLLPIAHAAAAAGHQVAFAGRPLMLPRVQAMGFTSFAAGSDRGLTPQRRPLLPIDIKRELRDLRDGFARRIARERAADLLPLCQSWQPDIIVWEETDFGAVVVAESLALPHANVLVIAAGSFVRPDQLAEPLNELRAAYSLAPDPELAMFSRYLVLSPMPARYRDPAFPLPPTAHGVRLLTPASAKHEPPPTWKKALPAAPTIYFTLGTVFNVESGNLFERVLAGVRDLPINLLVTVGWEINPQELGPQPPNVHITQHIPQTKVLPHVDLVISHGGSGSVMGSLAHGRPMLLIPMGADQPLNAARCATLGVAQVLDPIQATPADVRAAVTTILQTPSYRHAAQQLQSEIAALPTPEHAVTRLEQLVSHPTVREPPFPLTPPDCHPHHPTG